MKTLPENSVDAIVTDPPYGLEFMGKDWDAFKETGKSNLMYGTEEEGIQGVYGTEKNFKVLPRFPKGVNLGLQKFCKQWATEALRILKPGGYLLAFGGTRTYHRLACGIEDAGFEIRDCIGWIFGSGFPKSLNIEKALSKRYAKTKQKTKSRMSEMWQEVLHKKELFKENNNRGIMQELLADLEQGEQYTIFTFKESQIKSLQISERQRQYCLERGSNLQTSKRELQRCEICKMPTGIYINGKKRWVCYGTQIGDGKTSWQIIEEDGNCSSFKSQSLGQQDREFNVICEQCRTQEIRRHKGEGTALKPAWESIVVARKPLNEKNVVLNVLKWGTGGINIDECRIEHNGENLSRPINIIKETDLFNKNNSGYKNRGNPTNISDKIGRFPSNIILDEEAGRMLDEQSGELGKSSGGRIGNKGSMLNMCGGEFEKGDPGFGDKGGASRFFYQAKASKRERNKGMEEGETNFHPTIKPIKLMEYLIKLVSKEQAIVLDPFLGSGTTAIAALKLNRKFIGIEKEEEYIKIAEARLKPFIEQTKLSDK